MNKVFEKIKYSLFSSFWWRDFLYRQVNSRLNPRNKWLTNKIPRTWVDKDTIIEICIFESIKDYAENEVGLEWLRNEKRWEGQADVPEWQIKFENETLEYYKLLTETLVDLNVKMDEAWKKVPKFSLDNIGMTSKESYEQTYGEVDKLEKEISELKTKIMVWAVTNRECMWT